MKAVIQRVTRGKVTIEGHVHGEIGRGFVILLGVAREDTREDMDYLVKKISGLRIFEDSEGKMNLSLRDVKGELLVISQFTLFANTRKGNRPSFTNAGAPDMANALYEKFVAMCRERVPKVETGRFGADMKVSLENDGPFTILIDSEDF